MNKLVLLSLLIAAPFASAADAIVKLVIGTASAKPNTTLSQSSRFSTGKKSRSEVALPGGTLRTGSDTQVSMIEDGHVELHKGITLVASKPKFFRSNVRVTTPDHHLKVRGTAQIYYDPGHSMRIVVLEGEVTIDLASVRGESITLKRGQELIINPTDKQLPTPLEVDLNRLMSTMALLDQTQFPPLSSADRITTCARLQQDELTHGDELDATQLVMDGAGSGLDARTEELVHEEISDDIPDLDGDGEPEVAFDDNGDPIDETTPTDDDAPTDDNAGDGGAGSTLNARRKPGSPSVGIKSKPRSTAVSAPRSPRQPAPSSPRRQVTRSSDVNSLAKTLGRSAKGTIPSRVPFDPSKLNSVPAQARLGLKAPGH